ncbi:ATP-grasp ribosomal peptide maturase [Streptomyces inusitatus]|uniref:ATP-grasp ribosomal peptide maturase n=1 Tax=Streptomyces inusitatus TaxID=68221 RepID=A0A918ULI9_9ACTN|nr:ATP-grasp ribosomal peptide maturase [Streptomyces inusitatus]GGZ18651.1 ATP-grasp ribosomal peptide maturase [Streptomyces inusitatus]
MTLDTPVLVVSRLDDATADLVIEELNSRQVPVVRMDPGDFPSGITVAARLDNDGMRGTAQTRTRVTGLDQIRSVYWRRPRPWTVPLGLGEQEARWCREEARYGLGGVLASLPGAHYVNHPWRNRDAEYKPDQLATAARCGFDVPPTLLTNNVSAAREFAHDHGPVVYKPLRNTDYQNADGRALTVWVEEVDPADLGAGVGQTMHLFQKRVHSIADLRVTAVGEEVFTVRIDGSPGLDWRRHYDALSYSLIGTPPHLAKSVRRYLDAFGLVFGAFDFGVDQDGRIWLYECNPNGQFAWFPEPITGRIVTALADQLQHGGDHRVR